MKTASVSYRYLVNTKLKTINRQIKIPEESLHMRLVFYSIAVFIFFSNNILAQTCCSGGVPLSSNLGLPAAESQSLQFSLTYDVNVLKTLKSGSDVLNDQSRNRTTHSGLLELGYSFSKRISVDGFFSFVRQERTISQFGNKNFTYSQGIGDAVVLFKYQLFSTEDNTTQLYGAAGVKAPLGASDLRDPISDITLNADLQPGSGAWDGILWAQLTHVTSFRPSMSLLATATYALKGKNNSYFGSQIYQFGKELQLSAGISDRLILGTALIDPALLFRYRNVQADQNDGADLPSTGGNWLFFNPSISFWLSPNTSLNINGEVPLLANLEGTQVTPTYRFNIGFFQKLLLSKKEKLIPDLTKKQF